MIDARFVARDVLYEAGTMSAAWQDVRFVACELLVSI